MSQISSNNLILDKLQGDSIFGKTPPENQTPDEVAGNDTNIKYIHVKPKSLTLLKFVEGSILGNDDAAIGYEKLVFNAGSQ